MDRFQLLLDYTDIAVITFHTILLLAHILGYTKFGKYLPSITLVDAFLLMFATFIIGYLYEIFILHLPYHSGEASLPFASTSIGLISSYAYGCNSIPGKPFINPFGAQNVIDNAPIPIKLLAFITRVYSLDPVLVYKVSIFILLIAAVFLFQSLMAYVCDSYKAASFTTIILLCFVGGLGYKQVKAESSMQFTDPVFKPGQEDQPRLLLQPLVQGLLSNPSTLMHACMLLYSLCLLVYGFEKASVTAISPFAFLDPSMTMVMMFTWLPMSLMKRKSISGFAMGTVFLSICLFYNKMNFHYIDRLGTDNYISFLWNQLGFLWFGIAASCFVVPGVSIPALLALYFILEVNIYSTTMHTQIFIVLSIIIPLIIAVSVTLNCISNWIRNESLRGVFDALVCVFLLVCCVSGIMLVYRGQKSIKALVSPAKDLHEALIKHTKQDDSVLFSGTTPISPPLHYSGRRSWFSSENELLVLGLNSTTDVFEKNFFLYNPAMQTKNLPPYVVEDLITSPKKLRDVEYLEQVWRSKTYVLYRLVK